MAINPFDTPKGKRRSLADATRRQFLGIMGGTVATGAAVFGGVMSLKFLFPSTTNEAPAAFKAKYDPSILGTAGSVDVSNSAKRVTLVRDDKGIYAVYLVCTHLGCTPNYVPDVASDLGPAQVERAKQRGDRSGADIIPNGWACPCHGSRYFIDSTNFYGPAPRPMDWVSVKWADKDTLVVDRANIVVFRGAGIQTPPTWRLSATPGDNTIIGSTIGA